MSAAPFDVGLIQQRLASAATGLRSVGLAADYAAVRKLADFPAPCAYVLLATEQGLPKPPGNTIRGQQVSAQQQVMVHIGVAYALRSYRAQAGADIVDEWKAQLGPARDALYGFCPDLPGARPLEFVRGDLQDYDNTTALWIDVWSTQHTFRTPTGSR